MNAGASTALKAAATGDVQHIKAAAMAVGKDMKPKDQVKHLLDQNKHVIAQALPRHMNPERLLRVAMTSVTSNPALLECYVPTLIGGIIQCSQMGLEPNTVLGHAYLIPFWNSKKNRKDAQVIIGYKGLIDLARRSGQITSIAAHAVRQHDTFEYEYGLTEKLRHVPAEGDRGEITHFYAVAHMKDGGHAFEVMTVAAVRAINQGSQGAKNPVWKAHFEEMGRKTAIRRLSKYLPLSVELATAVAMEDLTAADKTQNLEGVLDGEYALAPDADALPPVGGFDEEGDETQQLEGAGIDRSTGEIAGNGAGGKALKTTLFEDCMKMISDAQAMTDSKVALVKLEDVDALLGELGDTNKRKVKQALAEVRAEIEGRGR